MPDNAIDNYETYSTGELAKACGVTVRTVQYYDEKGLLPPSDFTEGGRRVYTEDDAAKLRKVLLLKSLGLKLADIRSFLESEASTRVLRDILEAQDEKLAAELEERALALRRIAAMIESLDATGELPAETIPDMEDVMRERLTWRESELYPIYRAMLVAGILIDVVEIAAIVWWATTGDWRPFAIALPFIVVAIACVVCAYRKRIAYVCPHCRCVFEPKALNWFFATHSPTTRKVTCTACGTKSWCAEVSSERLADEREGNDNRRSCAS
ncbi:MAG: MerR family transcriptional regulator [Eggerthellaceae bacterium]|nr:MerR family transcriptional regulator [Eggerthellaceae bacterium]